MRVTRRAGCRLCHGEDVELALHLVPTPPANSFVAAASLGEPQECFPLDVYFCRSCGHAQLLDVVDATSVFRDYVYVSSTSRETVAEYRDYAAELIAAAGLGQGDLVVEIGSNDGLFLRFAKDHGLRVLGVDPAVQIAKTATDSGVPTLPEFFSAEIAGQVLDTYGPAKAVVANNVCAHVDDLEALVRAVVQILHADGTFVFQVSYLLDVVGGNLFDTIYHEHVDYHRVGPLKTFLHRLGLTIVDVKRVPAQGGSIRVYCAKHAAGRPESPAVAACEDLEARSRLDSPAGLRALGQRIAALGVRLRGDLEARLAEGQRIVGYGAPAKATTLAYQLGLSSAHLSYVVEDNPLKVGLFTPGLHLPCVPSARLYEDQPDTVVVLAWNFADSIYAAHKDYREGAGRFVVPLPEYRVL